MMAQYLELKRQHPGELLFYRMGDFYEMFFEDAEVASAALDITLTRRGKHLGRDISMCGVPQHAAEAYLLTLIRKGHRVAVCEQVEDPKEAKKRGAKAVVRREVVRLITPGTLTEDSLLEARQNNYLAAWALVRGEGALAWADVSTGEFRVAGCDSAGLGRMLARIGPRELLVRDDNPEVPVGDFAAAVTPLARSAFDSDAAAGRLNRLFGTGALEGFGHFGRASLAALGAVVAYLELTQRGNLPLLHPPLAESDGAVMAIDAATRRNLELVRTLDGQREGSLLAAIDLTATGAGARLLEARLQSPLTDPAAIAGRQDEVALFADRRDLLGAVREGLRRMPDLERSLSRLALDRGGPRDLAAVREVLRLAPVMAGLLDGELPDGLRLARERLAGPKGLAEVLEAALAEEVPVFARDGGMVAAGHVQALDEARGLRDDARVVVASLQAGYAAEAGVSSLKIRHNNVLGYFIETPDTHAGKMLAPPLSATFIHRQTTANSVRFTTLELSGLEARILNAAARVVELELAVFADLRRQVLEHAAGLAAMASALAGIDWAAALAALALDRGWVRPLVSGDRRFVIRGGRHPVVEAALRRGGGQFVGNDSDLSAGSEGAHPLWLLTGPNMAGKSTFLRQNALITLLAQTGSFVPADAAEIGVVDQLFSRVGAADDLARGRSTFLVEMIETAAILNQAGPRSLVILDEIGRGTSTHDGLSIAWATLEFLHDQVGCRALFATHYHELTGLAARLRGLHNATVAVREWEGDVIFLHEVRAGIAEGSYGIQVAKLAGVPKPVLVRAREVLTALEKGGGQQGAALDDLPLFSVRQEPKPAERSSPAEERLREVVPDELSPRGALDLIYELRALLTKGQ